MPIADYIRRMYRQYPEAPLQNTDPYRALTPWFENLPAWYLLPRSRPVPEKKAENKKKTKTAAKKTAVKKAAKAKTTKKSTAKKAE